MQYHGEYLAKVFTGGLKASAIRERVQRVIRKHDEDFSNLYNSLRSRKENFKRALKKVAIVEQLIRSEFKSDEEKLIFLFWLDLTLPYFLHHLMFKPFLELHMTEEQKKEWFPKIDSLECIGAYAQTEVGHGSNVQGLETLITYEPEKQQFDVHSPTLTASKMWAGGTGKVSNYCVLFGQLRIPKKNGGGYKHCGLNAFLVPLRNVQTHESLPNVVIGDIGKKMEMNDMDNGFIQFQHHKIPLDHMLARFNYITPQGEYKTRATSPQEARLHQKLQYATMLRTRVIFVGDGAKNLSKAVTIAMRYAHGRRQFPKIQEKVQQKKQPEKVASVVNKSYDDVKEQQLIDYDSHRYRLIPQMVSAFVIQVVGLQLTARYNQIMSVINSGKDQMESNIASVSTNLGQLHLDTSALKAFVTEFTASGIEKCRRCCGAHGYSLGSGLPDLYGHYVHKLIAEGDTHVMVQQSGRLILSALKKKPSQVLPSLQFLFKEDETIRFEDEIHPTQILSLFEKVVRNMVKDFRSQNHIVIMDQLRISHSYAMLICLRLFSQFLIMSPPKEIVEIFPDTTSLRMHQQLFSMYMQVFAFYYIQENTGDFLAYGDLTASQVSDLKYRLYSSFNKLRPHLLNLVDIFGWDDGQLHSVLGQKDIGNLYHRIIAFAKLSTLNDTDVADGFHEYLGPTIRTRL